MEPIKRLEDLTFAELIKIKRHSPEYNQLIDLECAHAGINLLPEHPGNAPVKPDIKPNSTIYKVGSWGFTSIAEAEAVVDFMVSKGIWKEENKSGVTVMTPIDENSYYWPEIKKTAVYTEDEYAQVKDTIKLVDTVYKEWKEKDDEYSAVLKERQEIIDRFDNKVAYASEVTYGIAKIQTSLTRYITLAQGSYSIAIGFLKEADKQEAIYIEDECVYYNCTTGKKHLVTTREQYQKDCMSNMLGADIDG